MGTLALGILLSSAPRSRASGGHFFVTLPIRAGIVYPPKGDPAKPGLTRQVLYWRIKNTRKVTHELFTNLHTHFIQIERGGVIVAVILDA
jgi:hypothetical protein